METLSERFGQSQGHVSDDHQQYNTKPGKIFQQKTMANYSPLADAIVAQALALAASAILPASGPESSLDPAGQVHAY